MDIVGYGLSFLLLVVVFLISEGELSPPESPSYTNQFRLKRQQANFNLQFVYTALKYVSQLGFVIGDTWKCKLHNEYPSIK